MKKIAFGLALIIVGCSDRIQIEAKIWTRAETELFYDNLLWKFYRNRLLIQDLQSFQGFDQWRKLRKTTDRWDLVARNVNGKLVFGSMVPLQSVFAKHALTNGFRLENGK